MVEVGFFEFSRYIRDMHHLWSYDACRQYRVPSVLAQFQIVTDGKALYLNRLCRGGKLERVVYLGVDDQLVNKIRWQRRRLVIIRSSNPRTGCGDKGRKGARNCGC